MRLICCMGGTGGGEGGRRQTKNREMEKKDAGREQGKVKRGGRGWAYRDGGEAARGGACREPLASAAERSREASGGAERRGAGSQPLAGPCGIGEQGPAK